ncbi:ribbon-helix-helix protein, CopG family [Chelativorans alearense]|uniref:ribbon-helix-helix protein, CopG family n=1 Tax=Chelativorans alearense TaxID=2681495 RepID=UPI0013D52E45|nr:ribbon-helix-helix protein, CopG family [Chelativorans alearense]
MKETVFTLKLDSELKEAFVAEAEAQDRPASQIVRELMRGYIERQREEREYRAFLQRKVEIARASIDAGRSRSNGEVEADFAVRRAAALEKAERAKR